MGSPTSANSSPAGDHDARCARGALLALNFFMADIQAGIGPFLGVFLQQRGWSAAPIGTVLSVGGVAGMLMTAPAGAFIDQTMHKRRVVIVSSICTLLGSFLVLWSQSRAMVMASQVATAVAGAAIGPAVAGITLGVVRQRGFNAQNGRNQAWNHAGNLVGAGLSGWLGWQFGMPAIFYLAAVFGVMAIVSISLLPERAIDHQVARGLEAGGDKSRKKAEGWQFLMHNKPVLILATALLCFHLGNAAMLPLYGMAVVGSGKGGPATFTATTIMVAQAVMIAASLFAMRVAARRGYWLVLLISFAALPLRGYLAGSLIENWGVWPVQALDGIGAGLRSVAVPGLVACLLEGSGRVNVGQGMVMTVQGIGASLSPALGGWLVQALGYKPAFFILGSFALVSVTLWLVFAGTLRPACAGFPSRRSSDTGGSLPDGAAAGLTIGRDDGQYALNGRVRGWRR